LAPFLETASLPDRSRTFFGHGRVALIAFLLAFGLTGCLAIQAPNDLDPQADGPPLGAAANTCQPSFPDQNGWLGGDAAFSVPLPDREPDASLWLFGDTFVARGDLSERRFPFVANSIGLSRCGADGFELLRALPTG
jgi:hypothetical protein